MITLLVKMDRFLGQDPILWPVDSDSDSLDSFTDF